MILITEFMDETAVERLKAAHPTSYAPRLADRPEELVARVEGIQALIVRNRTRVTATLLDAASRLKVVGRLGVGLDNVDLDACKAQGVEVIPAIGANTLSVAEYVVTNALILLRGAYQANARMLVGDWPRADCSGREASGRRLGLVGFGANGQETARLARALGMQVIAFDPMLPPEHPAWQGTLAASLDDVMEQADVISLHVPLTDQTRHLIDRDRLAQMKTGAVVINAARGGVVDDAALAEALRQGQIAGAALDVFETEPLTGDAAQIFTGIHNLVLTPHIAGVTKDSNVRVSDMIADHVLDRLA